VSIFLALAAAVSWGASDFLGGLAGRRSEDDRTAAITVWTTAIGMVLLGLLSLFVGGVLSSGDVVLGLVGGFMGALAIGALYRGLSVGTISVVAPITGTLSAALPVLVGVARGERPSGIAWVGIALALGSILLVAREEGTGTEAAEPNREALVLAVLSGIGFAGIFVILDLMSEGSGLWPLVVLKFSGAITAAIWMFTTHAPRLPVTSSWPLVVGVGVLDNVANVAYLLATRTGLLVLVAVLTSMYPAITVLLARTVLAEQLQRVQLAGMALAGAGVVAIALG
jgi:drug/metabolite transporter (DMT)-like permease